MSVLVYTESDNGSLKKSALEVASYAKHVADQLGESVTAVTINVSEATELGNYGVSKVLNTSHTSLENFNAKGYAQVIAEAAAKEMRKW